MDPNANVEEQIRLVRISEGEAPNGADGVSYAEALARAVPSRPLTADERARLRELMAALDGWITAGGFKPSVEPPSGPRLRKALRHIKHTPDEAARAVRDLVQRTGAVDATSHLMKVRNIGGCADRCGYCSVCREAREEASHG